jgi:hypothetical protein
MSREVPEIPGLGPEERIVHAWPAQSVQAGEVSLRRGLLVLTNQRCLFLRRAGMLSGRRFESSPAFATPLEALTSAHPRRFTLRIGYGDRMEIGGVEISGREFQLDRETDPLEILAEIAKARTGRLTEQRGLATGADAF